jgi:hypothetical protein
MTHAGRLRDFVDPGVDGTRAKRRESGAMPEEKEPNRDFGRAECAAPRLLGATRRETIGIKSACRDLLLQALNHLR